MMIYSLILLPLITGLFVLLLRRQFLNKVLLLGTAAVHALLTFRCWNVTPRPALGGWLGLDALGQIFLSLVSILFLAASIYAMGFLRRRAEPRAGRTDAPFVATLLFFLSTMTVVPFCQQFEILWVAIEATTLASAPLIYFYRNQHSLEATWKYLMICSVGIALALMGNFFLSIAGSPTVGVHSLSGHSGMLLSELVSRAPHFQSVWLRTAIIFIFVGYGTKMGLAPLHTWLPDAHSEAPAMVSSLLSGALLNCAFLGILRGYQVGAAAGQAAFVQTLLIVFGLTSMAFAAIFIIRQTDFKRMLAYSSVEHMGILAVSVGLGGSAVFGGMLHAVNHSLTKGMLFLVAGNILLGYRSKSTHVIRGITRALPFSGVLWFGGLFAITGSPPFGLFISELMILKSALEQGRFVVAGLYLVFLAIVFIGMADIMLKMLLGTPPDPPAGQPVRKGEVAWLVVPPAILGGIVLIFGLYIPQFLETVLKQASGLLGGG